MAGEKLRADAVACLRAGIDAVEPARLVGELLERDPQGLAGVASVWVVAVGKAAAAMARGARRALPAGFAGGVLIAPAASLPGAPEGLELYGGGHPIPNQEGIEGARAIRRLAEGLGEDDLLLCLISGGGSALMTLPPPGISLADLQATTESLLRAGATIAELNAVRKHLDLLKGGRLAAAAAPARVLALVLSDVVGDPLEVIASGPVTADPSTFREAVGILERFALRPQTPPAVRDYLERGLRAELAESPKAGARCFERVAAHVVGNNRIAAEAVLAEATRRGYRSLLLTTVLTGEAREVGRVLAALGREIRSSAQPLPAPACLVAAGETTVTVRGRGRGGRNQEVALGAALALEGSDGILVAAAGTDGVDGPTDAAGAMAAGDTVGRARELGLDVAKTLVDNDAYPFFQALDDLIVTGPTGTNVMDILLVLVG